MQAHAAQSILPSPHLQGNLFLPVPDSDFSDFLEQIEELAKFAPEILIEIDRDLDRKAIGKKKNRLAQRRYEQEKTPEITGLQIEDCTINDYELELDDGRPRMPAYLVYVFVRIKGYLDGSVTSREAVTFIRESMSLYSFLQNRGYSLPAPNTILDNTRAVSNRTRELILEKQIEFIRSEGLDDFQEMTFDSTQVEANSAWPTDSMILTGLITRAHKLGQKLEDFGLPNFSVWWVRQWLKKMKRLNLGINLMVGKPRLKKRKKKIRQHYRRLLDFGRQAAAHLKGELRKFEETYQPYEFIPPRQRAILERLLSQIREDIEDAGRVIAYAEKRVFEGKTVSSRDKVLSLADKSAAYIEKGGREAVIGYKPQIARSGEGFIAGLIVREGNPADKSELLPLFDEVVGRTGVIPEVVSADDGYAFRASRAAILNRGVKIMSLSGSRGKRIIGEEDWESEGYREARRLRSAVESLMFVLKHCFEFGRVSRRGIESVIAELLEKALAYNSYRITYLRRKQKQAFIKQAA
jgi:hypothetical protein